MGAFSALAFVLGGVTSIVSGYIGMMIAVKVTHWNTTKNLFNFVNFTRFVSSKSIMIGQFQNCVASTTRLCSSIQNCFPFGCRYGNKTLKNKKFLVNFNFFLFSHRAFHCVHSQCWFWLFWFWLSALNLAFRRKFFTRLAKKMP